MESTAITSARKPKKKKSDLLSGVWRNPHLWYITLVMLISAVVYYIPVIFEALGWNGAGSTLSNFHDLYGIDFFGLIFFIPVLFAAYKLDIVPAILTALIVFLILLPQAIIDGSYPNAMFKPTAFMIILSAVGAVVAMLQKSELEQRQRMREMKCIHDIGRATEEATGIEEFLWKTVALIPQAMPAPDAVSVSIKYRGDTFKYSRPAQYPRRITEDLVISGETVGQIIIRSMSDNPYVKKRNHLTRTLAERISGAIREMELAFSLQTYYEQLEDEVTSRTAALAEMQGKLIRTERLSAVGEMASGVGHELRNPLNVMRNCIYLLKTNLNGNGTGEIEDTLRTLDSNIDISNKIVTDLLDFTRIRKSNPEILVLNDFMQDTLDILQLPSQITVRKRFTQPSPKAFADAEQISKLCVNIVSNAVQSMKNGIGEIVVATGTDDGFVRITIQDTGCGIPEENLSKIFEPLFTTKSKGIGIGLAISRQLVEQNGGSICISSAVDEGSTVTIRLPAAMKGGKGVG